MEQPYSVLADWLSKFHTWPEFIQALWLVAVPVTVLGVTWIVMRGLRDIAAVWRGRGEAMVYGIAREWPDPAPTHRGGRLRVADGETPVPPLPALSAPPSFRGGPQDEPGTHKHDALRIECCGFRCVPSCTVSGYGFRAPLRGPGMTKLRTPSCPAASGNDGGELLATCNY